MMSEVPTGFLADRLGRKASLALGSLAGVISATLMLLVRNELAIAIAFCFIWLIDEPEAADEREEAAGGSESI